MEQPQLLMIPVGEIFPDPSQPRQHFEQDAIDRMEASILARGILQPIRIRRDAERGFWLIVSGECRWRAAKQAGLAEIPALLVENELSESDRLADQLIENVVRNELLPMELARSLVRLRKLRGGTAGVLAKELGISGGAVSKAASLLTLPEDIQAQIDDGSIAPDSGYYLSKLSDPTEQRKLAQKVATGQLSRTQTAAAVQQQLSHKQKPPKPVCETYRLPGGITVTVSVARPLTYETLLTACEQLRQQAETLQQGGRPLEDLPASLAESAVLTVKPKPATKAKPTKPANPVTQPSGG
jgi:ParB family chromosome partitioning protein